MKKARVSPVYEGRRKEDGSRGDQEDQIDSKRARINAKARIKGNKPNLRSHPKQRMATRSTKSSVNMKKTIGQEVDVSSEESKITIAVDNTVEKTEISFHGQLTEWPVMLTYEEEWMWLDWAFGCERWRRYDDAISGLNWFCAEEHYKDEDGLVWEDDIWGLRGTRE